MIRDGMDCVEDVFDAVLAASREAGRCVTRDDIMGKRRFAHFIDARHMVIFIMRYHARCGLSELGRYMNRDHSTIFHGADLFSSKVRYDKKLYAMYRTVIDKLGIDYNEAVFGRFNHKNSPTLEKPLQMMSPFFDVTKPVAKEEKREGRPPKPPEDENEYVKPVNYTKRERKELGLLPHGQQPTMSTAGRMISPKRKRSAGMPW